MSVSRYGIWCFLVAVNISLQACSVTPQDLPATTKVDAFDATLPKTFADARPGTSSAGLSWEDFFADPALRDLIDTALDNNQELKILLAELEIARNEAFARSGEYLPAVGLEARAGREKPGEFTRGGAVEEHLDLREGRPFPSPLPDYLAGLNVSWELDIWSRLRDAQKSAVLRYLATAEGRRFAQTRLVSEIAISYYELLALDRKEMLLEQMIANQESALRAVTLQKAAGETTELAVRRFDAELQRNRALVYQLRQSVRDTENRINMLAGRFPTPVQRSGAGISESALAEIITGDTASLLSFRPDVHQAELALDAARLDVEVARKRFLPSLSLDAELGFNASEGALFLELPESLAYGMAANLAMPLINRRGIQAGFNAANAKQSQALLNYQQIVLHAFTEVSGQLSRLQNLAGSLNAKRLQADGLTNSVDIATQLYRSARADYTEVLLTQREALDAQMELVELEQQQVAAMVQMYQLLGGGAEGGAS
jgi:NodT family efflux transporter outer membrane factor (OMF) lipoprotein